LILLSIGSGVFANELEYFEEVKGEYSDEINFLLRIVLGANILTIGITYIRYQKFIQWSIVKSYYTKIDTLTTTGKINHLIFESFLLLVGPYEFLKGFEIKLTKIWEVNDEPVVQYYSYNWNTVLMILSFAKGVIMLRSVTYFTRFTSPRA
jgi:hypothetical protein